ncbi:MAG: methyltransferase domain-containing protein [Chloroflexi bacterium]|nr:MAG: methyltransferase domain-containing protein [Chloroflexota bacterium]
MALAADDVASLAAVQRCVGGFLAHRGPRTRVAYANDLDEFARFRGRSRGEAVLELLAAGPREAVRLTSSYALDLRRQRRATNTIVRRLWTLRALTRRARSEGLVDWDLDLPGEDEIARAMRAEVSGDAPYLFPRHESEIDRLDVQHYALREALRGNYVAPIRSPARVLDVGCGTGQWAYDMCAEFPAALVIGYDLEPSKPGGTANYHFVKGNVLHGLPFADGRFDLVHQRLLLASGVPAGSWPAVMRDLVRVTRAGGWLELVEAAPRTDSPGPATEELWRLVRQIGRGLGLDTEATIIDSLADDLDRAGLEEVQGQSVSIPVGEWGGQAGSLLASGVRAGMMRLSDTFEARLSVPRQRSYELITAMDNEWDEYRSSARFAIAYGRKAPA